MIGAAIVLTIAALLVIKSVTIIGQAEVIVVERLGRFHRVARSGLNILIRLSNDRARWTCATSRATSAGSRR